MPRKARQGKYKMKTHKATAKRFRVTPTGKVLRMKGDRSHLRRRKPKRSKRIFHRMVPQEGKGYIRRIRRLAPGLWRGEG